MKHILLACVLAVSLPSMAAEKPNPADYTINVHVKSSELEYSNPTTMEQTLEVEIAGKHYRLAGTAISAAVHGIGLLHYGLLPTGDYKAKLVPHKDFKPDYLNFDVYELLLPDDRTLDCRVIGLYE
jgi:hypothetical protein